MPTDNRVVNIYLGDENVYLRSDKERTTINKIGIIGECEGQRFPVGWEFEVGRNFYGIKAEGINEHLWAGFTIEELEEIVEVDNENYVQELIEKYY